MTRRSRSFHGRWNIKTIVWHELLFFICKSFKSLLVIIKIVVVNNWLTYSWYLNTNIFQIKFNRLLRKDNQIFLTPSSHFRIVFEVGLYNWHLFPTKPVLSATCDLQSVSASRAVDTLVEVCLWKAAAVWRWMTFQRPLSFRPTGALLPEHDLSINKPFSHPFWRDESKI